MLSHERATKRPTSGKLLPTRSLFLERKYEGVLDEMCRVLLFQTKGRFVSLSFVRCKISAFLLRQVLLSSTIIFYSTN